MKHLKLFFACLLMAVLSIGQVWGAIDANSTWTATAFGDIPDGATVIMINNFGNSFANATVTKAPAKVAASFNSTTKKITVSTTGKSLDDIAWTVEQATNGTKFWVYGSTTNILGLSKTNDNNAVAVNTTSNAQYNEFVMGSNGKLLKYYNAARFVGEYVSGSDWRSYNTENANNYKSGTTEQALTFYVLDATPSCSNTVSVSKVTPVNGDFEISATEVCGDGDGGEVTISNIEPATGYTLDEVSVTVGTYSALTGKVTGITDDTEITVTFKALPKYTVSFNVGGSTASQDPIQEANPGEGITLPAGPTPTCSADGWTFAGWAEDAVASETTIAPTLLSGTYHPTDNVTLNAVYSRSEGTPETWNKITSAPSDWSGDYVLENSGYAMTSDFNATGEFAGATVTITDGKVVSPTNKMIWTFAKNGDEAQYSLQNKATGTYANITGTSSKNAGLSESAVWFTLSYSSSNVWQINSVTNSTRCFAYYSNNFRTYANSTASNGVNLYKKSGGTTYYYLSAPTCTPPAVADPVISLAEGEYEGTQSVTITCETTGAKIYYTTNGSDPTASSTLYNGAISVSASQTIKAIAIKDAVESNIVSAEYTIVTVCEAPTFSLAEGSYEGTQSVELSCTRAGVEIRYTTNGDEPTASSTLYEGAITVSSTQTIKAIAIKANLENSAVASATYTITAGPDVVLDFTDNTEWQFPTEKTQGSANYTSGLYTITVFGPSANKEGYNFYTSGGSNKLLLGKTGAYIVLPEFAQPIEKIVCPGVDGASGGVTWNVFDGETAVSDEATGCTSATTFEIENPEENKSYTIKVTSSANLQIPMIKIYFGAAPAVAKPIITGNAAFVGSQDVTITCATTGAAIYYTTDATKKDNPSTETWSAYGTKVTLEESCTLYAAAKLGDDWSGVASKAFTATPLYESIAALQGVATTTESTVFVKMTNWLVTAVSGSNAYVTDGSGKGMILYKYGQDFAQGDKLNKAQLQTTLQNYNGTYELKNLTTADFAGEGELVHGATIPAIAKTATEYAALTNANQGVLYVVNNLTYDATNGKFIDDDANEIAYYNKFSIDESALVDGHKYNVTGVAVYYKPNEGDPVVQLCPRTATDLQDNTAYVQIEFNANTTGSYGGTLPTTITNHISGTDYTIPAASLTREDGFYQLGWNTDPAATTALTSLTAITTDQILYAIWKETANCTISFYSKGQLYDTKVKAQNAEYDFNDVVAPTVQGWTFYGWSEDQIATEEASATTLDSYTPTSDTKNLYAVFSRKVDGTPYTQYEKVTSAPSDWSGEYLLVYESGTTAYVYTGIDANNNNVSATIAENAIASKPTDAVTLSIASMTGGYSIQVNGGDNDGKYISGTSGSNTTNFTDDAVANTLSIADGSAVVTAGGTIRFNSGSATMRFRYYKSGQAAVQLYKEKTVTPQVDVYTTAPVVRYNITFTLASGEEGTFNPISVEEGENAILPTEVPTKVHNTFDKWTDGANYYAAGATIENVQNDIELSATWTVASKANITFDLNGASGSIAPLENVYEGESYTLPDAPAYDEDHVFAGWRHGDDVYAANASVNMTTPAADIEYVAQWNVVVIDQVVILAKYAGNWYAVKNTGDNHAVDAVPVDYRYGNIYNDFTADQKAAITWTRKTVGNQMSFKNGTKYLSGKTNDSNDLDLTDGECFWTYDGNATPVTYRTHSNHSILYRGENGTFKNYKNVNASADGETGAYSALPIVTAAKFNTFYTRTVSGNYGTICLPKAGVVTNGTLFEIAYYGQTSKKIFFDEIPNNEMVAGRPYLFKPNENVTELKVAYTDSEDPVAADNYKGLHGFYNLEDEDATFNIAQDAGNYIMYSNQYWLVSGRAAYIENYRAYIVLSDITTIEPAKAPGVHRVAMNVNGTQVATGFENLNASEKPVKLMIDGNIYILRGEKLYDATGRLVK